MEKHKPNELWGGGCGKLKLAEALHRLAAARREGVICRRSPPTISLS